MESDEYLFDRCLPWTTRCYRAKYGEKFMVRSLKCNAYLKQIETKAINVESANSMTVVERYHSPISRAYKIIRTEAPDMDKDKALHYEVKSVNDSVGSYDIVPKLLVYGALPRLEVTNDRPSP